MNDPTVRTYDRFYKEFSRYFSSIGSRNIDIERGLSFLDKPKEEIRAVEIGCGDGRDGVEISKRVLFYQGFDPSAGLLSVAKNRDQGIDFVMADALKYRYPNDIDIVFAFASLLHVGLEDLRIVFKKVQNSLSRGGVFYISLKEKSDFVKERDRAKWGERIFYYYSVDNIKEVAGNMFELIYEDHQRIGTTDWFTLALRKE